MNATENKLKKLLQSKFFRNFLIYLSGALFLKGVGFFLLPFYTRILMPDQYGQLALLNTFIGVSSSILFFGLPPAVTIFYYKVEKDQRVETIINIIFLYLILSLPFIILMLFNVESLNQYIFGGEISGHLIILAVIITFFSFFPVVYYNVLKMEERALKRTILQVIIGLFIFASNMYLVYYLRVGIIGILVTNLAASIIILSIGSGEYLHKFKKIKISLNISKIKDFLKVGVPIVPGALAMWALTFADRWILMKYISYSDVGIYSVAYSFGMLWEGLILIPFAAVYTPRLFRAYKNDLIGTEKKNMRFLKYYFLFSLIIFIVANGVLYIVFPILIGEKYHAAYPLIWIIIVGYIFYGAFSLVNHFSYILKKTYYATICVFIAVGINIGLNLIFIPVYGIIAAAYTTMFSFFVMFIIGFILRTRLYRRSLVRIKNSGIT